VEGISDETVRYIAHEASEHSDVAAMAFRNNSALLDRTSQLLGPDSPDMAIILKRLPSEVQLSSTP